MQYIKGLFFPNKIKLLIYYITLPFFFRLKKFKNIHLGETCIILADSAEIKQYDLNVFDSYPLFSFNRNIMLKSIQNRTNKTYHVMADPFWFYRFNKNKEEEMEMLYMKKFIKTNSHFTFLHLSNIFSFLGSKLNYFYYKIPGLEYNNKILNYGKKPFQWTGSAALSLAIHMGFKKVIFIGVSLHSNSVENYWYHKGLGKKVLWENNPWNINSFFGSLNKAIVEQYIDVVVMASKKKSISIYPIISYEDFFMTKLVYWENFDEMSLEYLEIIENIYPGRVL